MTSLGLSEAVTRCGVSANTIRKRHRDGLLPNAVVDADGWQIPITDLIAAGLPPVSPRLAAERAATARTVTPAIPDPPPVEALLRKQIDTLERFVAAQAQNLDDLRAALAAARQEGARR